MEYALKFTTNKSHNFTHIVNGITYKLHIMYESISDSYYINVDKFTSNKFENIINSVKITTGIDLFSQYSYLGLGRFWVVPVQDSLYSQIPSANTLVLGYIMIWEH